ncbi:hypothetical protein SprV_0902698200 [Sparganum proliferum]
MFLTSDPDGEENEVKENEVKENEVKEKKKNKKKKEEEEEEEEEEEGTEKEEKGPTEVELPSLRVLMRLSLTAEYFRGQIIFRSRT